MAVHWRACVARWRAARAITAGHRGRVGSREKVWTYQLLSNGLSPSNVYTHIQHAKNTPLHKSPRTPKKESRQIFGRRASLYYNIV